MQRSNAAVSADPEQIKIHGLKEPVEVRRAAYDAACQSDTTFGDCDAADQL
jgi:hypothetical protein